MLDTRTLRRLAGALALATTAGGSAFAQEPTAPLDVPAAKLDEPTAIFDEEAPQAAAVVSAAETRPEAEASLPEEASAETDAKVDLDAAGRMDMTQTKRPFDNGFAEPLPEVAVETGEEAAPAEEQPTQALSAEEAEIERIAEEYLQASGSLPAEPAKKAATSKKAKKQPPRQAEAKPAAPATSSPAEDGKTTTAKGDGKKDEVLR